MLFIYKTYKNMNCNSAQARNYKLLLGKSSRQQLITCWLCTSHAVLGSVVDSKEIKS